MPTKEQPQPLKPQSLDKMEAILKIIEESVTKQEFLGAIKQLVTFVEGIKSQNESEFALLKEFFDAATGKLNSDTSTTLKEMKAGMNELFIGEKLAEMRRMHDEKMASVDERMAMVKDGEKGAKGDKGERGARGESGSPDTPTQVRDKLESLKGNERIDKSAIKGFDEIEKSVKEIGSRRIQTPAKAYRVRTADCSSQCDGSNKTFYVGGTHFGIIGVFGTQAPITYRPTIDYTETATGFTLTSVVEAPQTGQTLIAQFLK